MHGRHLLDLTSCDAGEMTEQIHAIPICQFRIGNKVKVDMDSEVLKVMQEGHGGWNPKMSEVGNLFLLDANFDPSQHVELSKIIY